jgi:hypothetical protein
MFESTRHLSALMVHHGNEAIVAIYLNQQVYFLLFVGNREAIL